MGSLQENVQPPAIVTKAWRRAIAQTGSDSLSFPEQQVLSFTAFPPMPQPASAQIEEGVIEVLKNVSRRPIQPTLDSDLVADLGFDSLQVLEVVAELEDRFDITIPLNDVPATRTVAQVIAQVAALVEGRPTA